MRHGRRSRSALPGTVINTEEYAPELREVKALIEGPRERDPVPGIISEALDAEVFRVRMPLPRGLTSIDRGGRLAVAAGQYLLWHFKGVPVPISRDVGPNGTPFYDLFHLYWGLIARRLKLSATTAADLVSIDMAGRGDTEPRHALVKLLERNFSSPAPEPLNASLREWGDELAIHPRIPYRKLAKRIYALGGV